MESNGEEVEMEVSSEWYRKQKKSGNKTEPPYVDYCDSDSMKAWNGISVSAAALARLSSVLVGSEGQQTPTSRLLFEQWHKHAKQMDQKNSWWRVLCVSMSNYIS